MSAARSSAPHRRHPASPRAASPPTSSTACCGSKRPLDEQLEASDLDALARARPRAGARTSSRPCCAGSARCAICSRVLLERGLPQTRRRSKPSLLIGAAQILFLDVPDHAAVDLSVRLAQADRHASHYAGLVNAVLRRLARDGKTRLAGLDTVLLDTPDWLMQRWTAHYGEATARAIAAAHAHEPALDLTVKSDPQAWAATLGGRVLPTGSVRTIAHGPVPQLPATTTAHGGCRTPPPPAGAACSATCAANPSPTSAPRPAARPRSWRRRRAASPPSTARQPRLERLRAESGAAAARRRDRRGRRHAMAGRPVRRRAARRALLVDRHDPPPSRHSLAQARGRSREARRPAGPAARPRRDAASSPAARWSIAPARWNRRRARTRSRRCSPAIPACAAADRAPRRSAGHAELLTPEGDLRTLPCHLPDPDPRMAGLDGFYAARIARI